MSSVKLRPMGVKGQNSPCERRDDTQRGQDHMDYPLGLPGEHSAHGTVIAEGQDGLYHQQLVLEQNHLLSYQFLGLSRMFYVSSEAENTCKVIGFICHKSTISPIFDF